MAVHHCNNATNRLLQLQLLLLTVSTGCVFALASGDDAAAATPESVLPFQDWLKEHGAFVSKKVVIAHTELGIGVQAVARIKADQVIATIPSTIMMTQFSESSSACSTLFSELEFGPTDAMALQLLCEKLTPDSKWKPYLDLLPEQVDTPLFWTEEELSYLSDSISLDLSNSRYRAATSAYYDLVDAISTTFPDSVLASMELEQFYWALSMVWSRSFHVKIHGRSTSGLVPFADSFNTDVHTQATSAMVERADRIDAVRIWATETIEAGQQIFVPYSDKPNIHQMLLEYGIVDPIPPPPSHSAAGTNREHSITVFGIPMRRALGWLEDVIHSNPQQSVSFDMENFHFELQQNADLFSSLSVLFVSADDLEPTELLLLTRAAMLYLYGVDIGAHANSLYQPLPDHDTERAALHLALRLLDLYQRSHRTSLAQDYDELVQLESVALQSDTPSTLRKRMALRLLVREKKLLNSSMAQIQDMMGKVEAAPQLSTSNTDKETGKKKKHGKRRTKRD